MRPSGCLLMRLTLLTLLRTSLAQFVEDTVSKHVPRIAVIGGGIGGTSTAYFLHDLFGDEALIDVYEPGHIGGRLATLPIGDEWYEVGGSIIHPSNKYMLDFTAKFGLAHRSACPSSMGVFNGKEYVFTSTSWSLVDFFTLLARYGWDIYRLMELPNTLLNEFMRIYTLQDEGLAYKDVTSFLSALSDKFPRMTKISTKEWFREQGFSDLIIDELVTAVIQCNYGQTPEMHAFVGSIAAAGADSNMWAVEGGNKRVPEKLLASSRAAHLRRRVTHVSPSSTGKFDVKSVELEEPDSSLLSEAIAGAVSTSGTSEEILGTQEYDIVILATPLTSDKTQIRLENFTREFSFPGRYETIFATMVEGKVRPESLMQTPDNMVDEVLVMNPKLMFNAFSKQHPVEGGECKKPIEVWKIFSPQRIEEHQLDIFFKTRKSTKVVPWLAYPHYDTNQTLGDFELMEGLYHLNAIEWAGSAMEMSIIGARNVALLAYKHWLQDPNAGRKLLPKEEL